ncbi:hypothetical protein C0J52_04978 [Blattella germanica]|nr:hypothetical protein C0J52_04978 [Blattella germanica]
MLKTDIGLHKMISGSFRINGDSVANTEQKGTKSLGKFLSAQSSIQFFLFHHSKMRLGQLLWKPRKRKNNQNWT